MDREGFRNRLKQYKQAREENPGLKYWEWKDQPTEKAIPKYSTGTGSVETPSLWDKFTNTVSVLYNNAARKVKNFLEEETAGEVIDLSNQQLTRVTPDTKNLTAIYGNEFVENNANNIRTRKQFEETADTLIGDKNIPLSRISNFYGVEDGKLKSGDLSIFDENTVVIPNRAKKTGKIKEIIFPDNTSSANLKELTEAERLNRIKRFTEMADSLGLKYGNNWVTQTIYGSPYTVIRDEYSRRKKSDITDEFTKEYERINRYSNESRDLANRTKMKFVTESNDTVFARDINIPQRFKQFYADEKGNALFVNNSGNLTKQQQEQINSALKDNPMYPILIDNGRYMHYQTNNPDYHTYTAYDFARDPKNMYVIGTIEK